MREKPSKNQLWNTRVFDSGLVADQPLQKIFLVGLIMSLIMGLLFRSITNPINVRSFIEKKILSMSEDSNVQFVRAEMNLKQGWLPKFQLKINELKIETHKPCLMKPEVYVDELRLPISLMDLVLGKNPFHNVQVNKLKIFLSEKLNDCQPGVHGAQELPNSERGGSPVQTASIVKKMQEPHHILQHIEVQNLEIFHSLYMDEPLLFSNVDLIKKHENDLEVFELNAGSHLFKDEELGAFLSSGRLFLKYKRGVADSVDVHFYGNLREGHYSIISTCDLLENRCKLESHFKEIPVKALPLFLKRSVFPAKLQQMRKLWVSMQIKSQLELNHWDKSAVSFDEVIIEGEIGRFYIEHLQMDQLSPLRWGSFLVNVSALDVRKVLTHFVDYKFDKHFEDLGQIAGTIRVQGPKDIEVSTQWSGLKIVFSNKGQRALQGIKNMSFNFLLKEPKWNVKVHHIQLEDGVFQGRVVASGDLEKKNSHFKLDVEELKLSPSVQELITNQGSISPLYLQMDYKKAYGEDDSLGGKIVVPDLIIENLIVQNLNFNWNGDLDHQKVQARADRISLPEQSESMSFFEPIGRALDKDHLNLIKVGGQFFWKSGQELSWPQLTAQEAGGAILSSNGQWDSKGSIRGEIELTHHKSKHSWRLQGDRKKPQLTTNSEFRFTK